MYDFAHFTHLTQGFQSDLLFLSLVRICISTCPLVLAQILLLEKCQNPQS